MKKKLEDTTEVKYIILTSKKILWIAVALSACIAGIIFLVMIK